ncbi:MAG: PLP-dependent aminotransferase family protein [Roseomonas sp.]|nr:PLP-dependent aminotransferase family protein [Roseomonas sp.]
MRIVSPWKPRLEDVDAPASERLTEALAADILSDQLEDGARLPAHRDMAWKLKISVGSVTKAYRALQRRGLIESSKGSGTFVIGRRRPQGPVIDLSVNAPPAMLNERVLSSTLSMAARKVESFYFLNYPPPAGHEKHRMLMAGWLGGTGIDANPGQLLLTSGAQQALAVAFATSSRPGGVILTECFTYPGALTLAQVGNYSLMGVPTDNQGMMPDALDAILATTKETPSALYLTPTLHNPTGATMGLMRRQEIIKICEKYNILIIEDDVYGLLKNESLPALVSLAPERTLYVTSLSKCLCPGLRVGMLLVPPQLVQKALFILQATGLSVSALSCAVVEQWLYDGTAENMLSSIGAEALRRLAVARSYLSRWMTEPSGKSFHVWLPMPRSEAERIVEGMAQEGVLLTAPASVLVVGTDSESGIRLCLGVPSLDELHRALAIMKQKLECSGYP